MPNKQNYNGANNSSPIETNGLTPESLQIFNFNGVPLRMQVNSKGKPEFCAMDITSILEYANGRKAVADLCFKDGVTQGYVIDSKGRKQSASFLSEPNLYRLAFKCTKPAAEPFITWLSEEVLPSIRKYGMYATNFTMEKLIANPDLLIGIASELKKEKELREQAEYDRNKLAERNKDYERVIMVQDQVLHKNAVKVQYHDKVLLSKSLIATTVIAKELGMSAIALNKKLRQLNIIYPVNGTYAVYSKFQEKEYAKYKTYHYTDANGNTQTSRELYWTEPGRLFIIHLLRPEMKLEPPK